MKPNYCTRCGGFKLMTFTDSLVKNVTFCTDCRLGFEVKEVKVKTVKTEPIGVGKTTYKKIFKDVEE